MRFTLPSEKRTEKKRVPKPLLYTNSALFKIVKRWKQPKCHELERQGTGESLLNGYRALFYGDENVLELEMVVIHHCECTQCY